jgi:hypothetical protein
MPRSLNIRVSTQAPALPACSVARRSTRTAEGPAARPRAPLRRQRPWTLRAAEPCELWVVGAADLSRIVNIYPALRLVLLEHVRSELVRGGWKGCQLEASDLCPSLSVHLAPWGTRHG